MLECDMTNVLLYKPNEAGQHKAGEWRKRHGAGSTIETVSPVFEENVAVVSEELKPGNRVFSYGGDGMASIAVNSVARCIHDGTRHAADISVGFLRNGFMNNADRWANGSASPDEVITSSRYVKAYPIELRFEPDKPDGVVWRRWALLYAGRNLTAEIGSIADAPDIRHQREQMHPSLKLAHGLGMALRYYGTSLVGGHIMSGKEHDVYLNGPEITRVQLTDPTITDPGFIWHYDHELGNPLVMARDVIAGLTTRRLPVKRISRDSHRIDDQQTLQADGEVVFFNGTPRRLGRRGLSASATHLNGRGQLYVGKAPFGVWVVSPAHGETLTFEQRMVA
ncbi:MAG: hypothetical protein WBB39_03950 [Candidatus Saccharimonadales bacterium]